MQTVKHTPCKSPAVDDEIKGQYISLQNLTKAHIPDLWRDFGADESTWEWFLGGAPNGLEGLQSMFRDIIEDGNIALAIVGDPGHLNQPQEGSARDSARRLVALGVVFYGDVKPQQRTIEAGVIFGLQIRRTIAATEAHYLLLNNIFDPKEGPPYRRCAWKTNSCNVASIHAAQRLGYVYEGTFRKHMIDNGKSRDTVWLSVIDDDWPIMKAAFEKWLDLRNFDGDGRQIQKLEQIRRSLKYTTVVHHSVTHIAGEKNLKVRDLIPIQSSIYPTRRIASSLCCHKCAFPSRSFNHISHLGCNFPTGMKYLPCPIFGASGEVAQ